MVTPWETIFQHLPNLTSDMPRQSVLFVCTHNSARSQMAEGLLRARHGDRYEVFSAGTERTHVRPQAIAAMGEIDIDLSEHSSKTVEDLGGRAFDYVVTVCDSAREACPYVPATEEVIHQSFPDPSAATGSDQEKLQVFRDVRDQIGEWIEERFGK
ncbi:arsenate reductase ArsC [soil metagenome]